MPENLASRNPSGCVTSTSLLLWKNLFAAAIAKIILIDSIRTIEAKVSSKSKPAIFGKLLTIVRALYFSKLPLREQLRILIIIKT